jgi:hypothetical protein
VVLYHVATMACTRETIDWRSTPACRIDEGSLEVRDVRGYKS